MIKSFILKIINGKWSAPFFITAISIFFWLLMWILPVTKTVWNLCFIIPLCTGLVYTLLGISKLFKKRFKEGFVQIILSVVFTFIACVFFFILTPKSPYKEYKGNIVNPNNVKVEMPLDFIGMDEKPLVEVKGQDVLLYNYQQPGQYKYDVFLNKIEKGKIYLKLFDLTTNRLLSSKKIKRETQLEVENTSDELEEFESDNIFVVEEGEWGNYYGSRVEVWFRPDDSAKPERKLLVKNYVIQGN